MKAIALSALAALAVTSGAFADPTLQVDLVTDDAWLQSQGLVSATISVTGFADGQAVQGLIGTNANPFIVSAASGFYNTASTAPFWNGEQPFAGDPAFEPFVPHITWDSGFLPPPGGTNPFGNPQGDGLNNVDGFALASDGGSVNAAPFFWLSLQGAGVPVNAATVLPVLRITWNANEVATVGFTLVMNTPEAEYNFLQEIAVPAPGALALLGMAGLVGARRRRA